MGKKIKNILVPLDGSKNSIRGLDEAIYIARQCHSKITGLYVNHVPVVYAIHPLGFLGTGTSKKTKKLLESAKTRAAKKGIVFNSKIISGVPGYDIVNFAHRRKYDMIVIGARGLGSVKEVFLGSVSNYVVHKSKIPVVLVK
jgi:nucleotide-binding universal stress UspA family protein